MTADIYCLSLCGRYLNAQRVHVSMKIIHNELCINYVVHAAYNNLKCYILEVTVLSESARHLLCCYGEDTDYTFN
jgi:hypothetical protein